MFPAWGVVLPKTLYRNALRESLLRLPEVILRTTMCRTKIYTLVGFPKPIKVGGQASAWIESKVEAWLAQTIAAGRQARAA
jgi:predicted DNA-binding transcriptional regulator AlpA